ncbi:MAG: transporter substrate-binding domain-containing protein [Lachnospiraceae bacterium]|nr:transporter substrate-binding domain-containing protein [Candidatus Equihabitans merdae]
MKKMLVFALTAVMAFSMTACGAKQEAAAPAEEAVASEEEVAEEVEEEVEEVAEEAEEAEEAAELKSAVEDGIFTVGFDAEYPPYGYMDDNGEYTGFDLELAQAVCDLEGWELEKKPINWDAKDAELNAYAIDCIWNGFTMNGREDDYTFSVPYVNNSQVIVVSSESGIKTLADLEGKVVGVQQASAALDVLTDEESDMKELGDSLGEIKQFSDYNTAFTELQAGALDGLAIDIGVAKYQLNSRGEGFEMLEEALNAEEYAVGFRLGDTEMADIINADLAKLMEDGTIMKLAEKYEIADMISLE